MKKIILILSLMLVATPAFATSVSHNVDLNSVEAIPVDLPRHELPTPSPIPTPAPSVKGGTGWMGIDSINDRYVSLYHGKVLFSAPIEGIGSVELTKDGKTIVLQSEAKSTYHEIDLPYTSDFTMRVCVDGNIRFGSEGQMVGSKVKACSRVFSY